MSEEKTKPVGSENNPSFAPEDVSNVKSDMGKVALVISILAVVLLIIFYYTVNSSIDRVSEKVGAGEEAKVMVQEVDEQLENEIKDIKGELDATTRDIAGLTETTQEMDKRMGELEALPSKVEDMDKRIQDLEDLPSMVRNMVLGGMLEEMSQKADYVGTQVDPEQQEKLNQARELLREVQKDIGKE